MSSYKAKQAVNVFSRIVSAVLILLLLVGVIRYFNRPTGFYLTYGESNIQSDNSGIFVPFNGTETFIINNTDGFGTYSVTDCCVKIIPNVDDIHDFEFTVDGNEKPSIFSSEKDLTAAFVDNYDGKGLQISSDGSFTISITQKYVSDILQSVYGGKAITVNEKYSVAEYPYIALSVTSPDNKQNITVPLRWYVAVDSIKFDKTQIVF